MSTDVVKLVIGGKEFTGWTGVSISMSIDSLADSFSLSAPYDPSIIDLVSRIAPYGLQPVDIYIDSDPYLRGRLEGQSFSYDPNARTVTLSGRSLTGVLCDCSVDPDTAAQVEDLTFAQIAAKTAKSFGLSIRDDDSRSATRNIPEARAEFGDSAFDFLHKLAAPHNLLLNSSFDGRLVITYGDDLLTYPIRANLVEGDASIISLQSSYNSSKRGSVYKIATQFAGVPDIMGSVTDPDVTLYRPMFKAVEESDDTDPDATAARMMTEAIASSLSISATLDGWRRPDGARWSERMAVTLKAPSVYVLKTSRFVVAGLTLKLDPQTGRTSELRLVPPEVYSTGFAKAKKKKVDLW